MTLALFDILTGRFRDGRPVRSTSSREAALLSLRDSVEVLLNARSQVLPHLSGGLPDMGEIYEGLPYSMPRFVLAVQATVAAGEPRLSDVQVRPCPDERVGPRLALLISGRAQGRLLRFRALFQGGFAAKVVSLEGDLHA